MKRLDLSDLAAATIAAALDHWRATLEADDAGIPRGDGRPEPWRFVHPTLGTLDPSEIEEFLQETGLHSLTGAFVVAETAKQRQITASA